MAPKVKIGRHKPQTRRVMLYEFDILNGMGNKISRFGIYALNPQDAHKQCSNYLRGLRAELKQVQP